jgi:ComF family protein
MKIRKLYSFLLEALFPRYCISCGSEGSYICEDCSIFLSESRLVCPACGKNSYYGTTHKGCKSPLNGLISLWDYESIIKMAIDKIKDDGVFHITEELIEHFIVLLERDSKRFSLFLDILTDKGSVVTFVPLSSRKKRIRGFDQSEILAGYLARILGKKRVRIIKKTKETIPQSGLKKRDRFLNVKGSFSFVGSSVDRVILVDDIWTSGATMRECAKLLKRNGVKEVWGFVLAS